jgi:hypothetical protein
MLVKPVGVPPGPGILTPGVRTVQLIPGLLRRVSSNPVSKAETGFPAGQKPVSAMDMESRIGLRYRAFFQIVNIRSLATISHRPVTLPCSTTCACLFSATIGQMCVGSAQFTLPGGTGICLLYHGARQQYHLMRNALNAQDSRGQRMARTKP